MLRSLRARIHLALSLEPRDELAGFWAVVSAVAAMIAALVYLSNHNHPLALLVALAFANAAILSLFRPATRKKRTWRRDGIDLVVVLAHLFAGRLLVRYLAGLSIDWDEFVYVLCGALVLFFVWQLTYRVFWRPRAFQRRRRAETLGSFRGDFPRL